MTKLVDLYEEGNDETGWFIWRFDKKLVDLYEGSITGWFKGSITNDETGWFICW